MKKPSKDEKTYANLVPSLTVSLENDVSLLKLQATLDNGLPTGKHRYQGAVVNSRRFGREDYHQK